MQTLTEKNSADIARLTKAVLMLAGRIEALKMKQRQPRKRRIVRADELFRAYLKRLDARQ